MQINHYTFFFLTLDIHESLFNLNSAESILLNPKQVILSR